MNSLRTNIFSNERIDEIRFEIKILLKTKKLKEKIQNL